MKTSRVDVMPINSPIPSTSAASPVRPVHIDPPAHAAPQEKPRVNVVRAPTSAKRTSPSAPKQRWWLSLLILGVLGGGGYVAYPRVKPFLIPNRAPKAAPPVRVIPVVSAPTVRSNMCLYLNGLGTATGFKTVTVRSRIEGELVKVAFEEGQMVREGDLLAEIDSRPFEVQLKEADAQLLKDKAALRLAISDYQRYEALVSSRTVTQQQLDAQKVLVQQSQATLQADEGRIENIRLQLAYCKILAPIGGRIGLRNVDAGNMVRANDTNGLAVITQLQPIAVIFPISQDDIALVQKQLVAGNKLAVDAFDRDFRTMLATGELVAVDNQVDVSTGTVRMKAVFANEDNLLFPNQFVNARLRVDTLRDVILAPSAAVQQGPESSYVYVVKNDSTVDLRTVVSGPTEGDQTVIENGLAAGESVVIDGVDKLQNGSKVAARVIPAAGSPRATAQVDEPSPKGS